MQQRRKSARRRQIGRDAPEIRFVKAIVSSAFATSDRELNARTRCCARVAFARQVAMYLAHVAFGMPLCKVARTFGRHHTTAAHACKTVEDRRDSRTLDYALDRLEKAVRHWALVAGSPAACRHG